MVVYFDVILNLLHLVVVVVVAVLRFSSTHICSSWKWNFLETYWKIVVFFFRSFLFLWLITNGSHFVCNSRCFGWLCLCFFLKFHFAYIQRERWMMQARGGGEVGWGWHKLIWSYRTFCLMDFLSIADDIKSVIK